MREGGVRVETREERLERKKHLKCPHCRIEKRHDATTWTDEFHPERGKGLVADVGRKVETQ
jgi:hypothetical protein